MADEIEIEWSPVNCGTQQIGIWVARLIRPVRSVPFAKVVQRLDGGWSLWHCPKGMGVDDPYSIHRYGLDRFKPMAHEGRWARAHWRAIPRA